MITKGKTILFLGDSITDGYCASSVEKRYSDLVTVEGEFAEGVNYGVGGTRIAKNAIDTCEAHADTFEMRAKRMQEKADIIIVFGGTNDYGHGDAPLGKMGDSTVTTFYGAMDSLINTLINKYPLATIVFCTPIHRKDECKLFNENGVRHCATLGDYVNAEKEVCARYGIPVCDLYTTSGICPDNPINCDTYTADGLHPNDVGYRRIADRILQFIKYSI